ncbi:CPBP family intramembrane metalloprotease [Sphingomonas sp. So64.6b]|uniref:CPBP family intramembrane glutamic endopeptidase n=1 Tax=Sphingomonas sp. So64.6b TaxID=2997354 RepID=UPI0015FEE9E3|nr:CPBP family intramembrane glutamic endopeptidase [Sphingomonas sp. So64.6b]QNA84570.1 CPBP family intramembrane metalloprotease [Sphingomonas sp. So64.6b]
MEPTLPNTPPNSIVWRIVHFPLVLLGIGMTLVLGSQIAIYRLAYFLAIPKQAWTGVLIAVCAAGLAMVVYAIFVRFVERRDGVAEFGARGWAKELGGGLLGGVLLFTVVAGIIAAMGGYRVVGLNPVTVLIPVLALSITSGVVEEIIVRGLIFRIVESSLGSWIALIISAVLFGAGHLGNQNSGLLPAIAIALEAGIMLAALYMITRRLWAAIGLHAAWNFTQGGIYGFPVSGGAVDGVLKPVVSGPEWLTGRAFGPEASLPAIIVCTAFGIALLVIAHRRGRFVAPFWLRSKLVHSPDLQE